MQQSPSTAARLAAECHDRGAVAPKRQGRAPGTAGKLRPHSASPGRDRPGRTSHHTEGTGRGSEIDAWRVSSAVFDPPGAGPVRLVI